MNLSEFINAFASEFTDTPPTAFNAKINFKALEEWDSVMALSIISMVEENFNLRITGNELREYETIEDLYNFLTK
jgi:acyl carrier protein